MAQDSPREKAIVNGIVAHLKNRQGCWYLKTVGSRYGRAGIPDLLICMRGRFISFEVKRPGENYKPTRLQQAELAGIDAAGGVARVVHSLEEAKFILDYFDPLVGQSGALAQP